MNGTASFRAITAGAEVRAAVADLLGIAGISLRDDPKSTRTYLIKAISLLDAEAGAVERLPHRPQGGLAAWQMRRIDDYVGGNIGTVIRTRELARVVNLSVSHFSRAFRQSFGDTPSSYVARRRVDLACRLMLETDTPLSQIALDCGLCDQSHLTRVFRRYVGTSPRSWRRMRTPGVPAERKAAKSRESSSAAQPRDPRNSSRSELSCSLLVSPRLCVPPG